MNDFLQWFFVLDQAVATNKKSCCDWRATELLGKCRKMLQLRLGRENILTCLRQDVRQKGFLQLLLR
jgi:hypothetical protein